MRLQDNVAIITGAGSGIGRGMAQRFAAEGAAVMVADINGDGARATAASIDDAGGRASASEIDVRALGDVERMVGATVDAFDKVDILINCAGTGALIGFLEMSSDAFQNVIAVNLTGTFHCGQAAGKAMVRNGYGRIVNIASIAGERAGVGRSAYGTSKGAVMALTRQMAVELGPLGITVNAIAPGPVDTELTRVVHNQRTRDAYARMIPLKRYGAIEEMASAAVYLASEEARYVNGHVLSVDGGFTVAGILDDL